MRTLVILFLAIFMVNISIAQEEEKEDKENLPGPAITFAEEQHDFGDIYQGDVVKHTFKFENTGDEPLVLSNVAVTCGCTATDWPREPIAPGEEESITVQFDSAGKLGKQNKIITIYSNANKPVSRVAIVTNVLPKKKDS